MQFEQRSAEPAPDEGQVDRLWWPVGLEEDDPVTRALEGSTLEPDPADHYVVVDERVGSTVGLVFTTWPGLDEIGRVRFPEEDGTTWLPEDRLLVEVDGLRARRGQVTRPLRIGDAFWVRGFDPRDPAAWADLLDVTAWARDAAKIALFGTSAGLVPAETAGDLGLVSKSELAEQRQPPPASGGVAAAAI